MKFELGKLIGEPLPQAELNGGVVEEEIVIEDDTGQESSLWRADCPKCGVIYREEGSGPGIHQEHVKNGAEWATLAGYVKRPGT